MVDAKRAPETALRPLPLSEPMFLILAVLADGPRHGYGILRALEERSSGEQKMLTGTLYNALRRLQSHGLVEARKVSPNADESPGQTRGARRTKEYSVTDSGLQSLHAEAQRMRSLLRWSPSKGLAAAMEEGR